MARQTSGFYASASDRAIATADHLSEANVVVRSMKKEKATSATREREGFNHFDMDDARPENKMPTKRREILIAVQSVYRRVGIIRNTIDLMADFAGDGMAVAHPTKSQEVFYKEWARRVHLPERAREFMRLLLRDGNVVGRRSMAKIGKAAQREFMANAANTKVRKTALQPVGEIPWGYTFMNPAFVDKSGGPLGRFIGDQHLKACIPPEVSSRILNPRNDEDRRIVSALPDDIKRAIRKTTTANLEIPLDPDTTFVYHYKKNDWDDWATPFLYAVLDDVMFKDKMRLADMATLDGVINVIRLWRLGKAEQKILPGKPAFNKLLGILQGNVGGGVLDIVWDDMIDVKVEYPPVDKILGSAKYESVNRDIQIGLGVPDVLTGSGSGKSGSSGGMVHLKTMTERLEYVRSRAMEWLEGEFRIVMRAMRWKIPPAIGFENMSLRDEAAEKQLLIQLADRGIISVEAIHSAFDYNTLVEIERLRREQQLRKGEKPVLERAGPYYRPTSQLELQFEQQRSLLEVKSNQGGGGGDGGGDNPAGDQSRDTTQTPSPGRPPNTRDTKTRDQRTPKTLSILAVTAETAMDEIDAIVDPQFLKAERKPNIRSLSGTQRSNLENAKLCLLSGLRANDKVSKATLKTIAKRGDKDRAKSLLTACQGLIEEFRSARRRAPNAAERRKLLCAAWANLQE